MSRRVRTAGIVSATVLLGLITAWGAGADPIGFATYKGKGRGDVDKVDFQVSDSSKVIGTLDVGFDARCRQGGKRYTNKNTGWVFYTTKIRDSGEFKARDVKHFRGKSEAHIKGRFSDDGRSARGTFTYKGSYDPGNAAAVHCHGEGRFKVTTNARPEDDPGGPSGGPPEGDWAGTTAQGREIYFVIRHLEGRARIEQIIFYADLDCVRDEGAFGPAAYTDIEYSGSILQGRVDGTSFEAAQDANRISGTFDGKTATGTISVTNYRDEYEDATCSTPGEVPFTARLS